MLTTALLGLWATCVSPTCDVTVAAGRGLVRARHDIRSTLATVPAGAPQSATAAPTTYAAVTNRATYPKPAVPALGPAGYGFNDPTFGSRIARITDGNTRPGFPNRSYRVASNEHLAAWNANSTAFYVVSNDGTSIPYTFDAATMTARRINPSGTGDGGLTLPFYIEPHFSATNPNLIFGAGGSNNRTILQYDFAANRYTTVLDLDTIVGGLASTYVGAVMTAGSPEQLMAFFGGAGQDAHFYLLYAPLGNLSARKILNTVTSTINGFATNLTLNFHIHSAAVERSGRYVFIYPTSVDLAAPRRAAQVYLWDTVTDQLTALPTSALSGGHDAFGFGYSVNQDCCTSTSWDAMQWQFRNLANPTATTDLISPVLLPKEVYIEDHTSWSNARPDALVPVISSTYRYYGSNNTTPWRAWDDEIIAVDTAHGSGATVWRFAHHRSNTASDNDPNSLYFWYEPIISVSPDGRWAIFTSNWEKTLGRDSSEPTYRQDVFVVQLLAAGGSAPPVTPPTTPPSTPPSSPPSTPSPGGSAPPQTGPFQLTAAVSGSTVVLDWQVPNGATPGTSYIIEAGSAPGLTDLAAIAVGTSTHYVAPGVGSGIYFVRVRASNGVAAAVSTEATVVVGGGGAMPPAPTANASVSGRDVTLRWSVVPDASSYVIEAGSAPGLRELAYLQVTGGQTMLFAPNVGPGVYYVRIRGFNPAGAGPASNELVVVVQ